MRDKKHSMQVPDTVYQTDQWSRYLWKQHVERSGQLEEIVEQGEKKAFNFPSFAREVFHRLYADNSAKLDNIKPENRWAEKAHAELDQIPAFGQLNHRCRGDKFLSSIAATAFSERALQQLPSPTEKLEDPEPLRQQIKGLMELAKELGEERRADVDRVAADLRDQGKRAVDAAQAYAADLDPTDIRQALRSACAKAQECVDEAVEQLAAFGGWGDQPGLDGRTVSAEVKVELARRVRFSPKLQDLAREAGRLRRIAAAKQRSKADHARDEVADIELGADLDRVLPSELVKLTHPGLALDFARKYQERGLLQYRLTGKEPQGRGPIVVCLDGSSSMEGPKEIWAKALALALLQIATQQRRCCRVIHFNSQVQRLDDWMPGSVDSSTLLASMEFFPGGGTSFEAPLESAVEAIESQPDLKKADVILITDGECEVSKIFAERWQTAKARHELTAYAVHVDAPGGVCPTVLNRIADKVVGLPDLRDDSAAAAVVLSI